MAEFTYKVINKKGAEVNGVITAASRENAVTDLRNQGNRLLSVKEGGAKDGKKKNNKGDTNRVVGSQGQETGALEGIPFLRAPASVLTGL